MSKPDPSACASEDSVPTSTRMDLFRTWLGIGCLSFGGPAAQIALMHRVIVDQRRWLQEKQYLNALSFCMLLPGPEAMQLATFVGWRTHGVFGGLLAGLCFVLPGALLIFAIGSLYVLYGTHNITIDLFLGIKAAVLAIVLDALVKVWRRALLTWQHRLIAAISFVGLFFFALPFPLIILLAAAYGYWSAEVETTNGGDNTLQVALPDGHWTRLMRTIAVWLFIWWLPVLLLWVSVGEGVLLSLALFFSKLAVVSFGGAYAVLAYVAQDVVSQYQWLSATQMMDALGLAETTPGPLILVTQFVGILAGFGEGGIAYAVAAGVVALWVTFVPCFLWIFAGAPYMQWLVGRSRLRGALSGISAAVVGVILNLSLWFALHVVFSQIALKEIGLMQVWIPQWDSFNGVVVLLSCLAALLLLGLKWGVMSTLFACAILALLISRFDLSLV